MLEEKDLQAIAQIMDSRIGESEKRMANMMDQKLAQQKREIMGETKELLSQQKREIMQEVGVLIENEVTPRFNLLAEGQEDILRRMPDEDDMDSVDERLSTPEAMVKKLNREVAQLKKAQ